MVMTNHLGNIVLVNSQAEVTFGYNRNELIGCRIEMLIPERFRANHPSLRGAFFGHATSRPMGVGSDLFGLTKDGREFPVEIGLNPIETETGTIVISSIVDISERKRLEARLRVADEAVHQARKMESLGHLTGGIAHDFNNALTIIIGNLDIVRRSGEIKTQRIQLALQSATHGSANAAKLTKQLLGFSRQQKLDPERLSLNVLIKGMTGMLVLTLGTGISLELVLAEDVGTISTDASLLENALLNIAINARDAMPDGGRLKIVTSNSYLDASDAITEDALQRPFCCLVVTDTGSGMTKETREKAFEPFFTTKGIGKGTGLGLSQVYGFVNQSGGCVQLESEIGLGTTFRLHFPRLDSEVIPASF